MVTDHLITQAGRDPMAAARMAGAIEAYRDLTQIRLEDIVEDTTSGPQDSR